LHKWLDIKEKGLVKMEDNISKGLFGLNRKDVENYIADMKKDYENELRRQNQELLSMKSENAKLNDRLNELLSQKREIEEAKRNISDVLFKAEQQAKQIVEDAKTKAMEERQEIDALIETEKEKLIDAKIELAMLKDKAKDLIAKFTDDITKLQ
jgi:cell division initiation protein